MYFNILLALHLLSPAVLAMPSSFAMPGSAMPQPKGGPGLIENLLHGILNDVQTQIKDVLSKNQPGQDFNRSPKPVTCFVPGLDKCCVWYDVSAELTKLFLQPDGQCNDNARAAVRFAFHDAGAWDKNQDHGGADGSLMMDFGEISRPENNGLQNIWQVLRSVQSKYKVGYADLAQYAHNHAVVTCPKGPSIKTYIGRKDATQAAPDGLIPNVHDAADSLVALFADKGINGEDLAALLGAHSVGRQRFVDTSATAVNKAFDSTIGTWDVSFYNETLENPAGSSASQKIFVLPSDKVLSQHPAVSEEWHEFVGDQKHWNEDYATAAIRMGLLGVTNLKDLSECTRTLPPARLI